MASDQFHQQQLVAALARCENEPIHHIGAIQPHGILLALEVAPPHRVVQASENAASFFTREEKAIHGQPLETFFPEDGWRRVAPWLASHTQTGTGLTRLDLPAIPSSYPGLRLLLRQVEDTFILELLPITEEEQQLSLDGLFQPLRETLWRMENETDPDRYCQLVADMIQILVGFDRVMVYRFDEQWDGEVIAEARNTVLPSYLGNRFPAEDIPPQARRLYTRNPIRMIADVDADPVSIRPFLHPITGVPLDLSDTALRSFSPVHVEYLRNMGVAASLSISLLQNGRLWGLVACHHSVPRVLPYPLLEMAEFVGRMASMKLSAFDTQEQRASGTQVAQIVANLLSQLQGTDPLEVILQRLQPELLSILDASGLLLSFGDYQVGLGVLPDSELLEALTTLLINYPGSDDYFATDQLAIFLPAATQQGNVAAGVLAVFSRHRHTPTLIWFRPEKLREVRWAGNPAKTMVKDRDGGLRISPRTSFENWSEIWRGRSAPWRSAEVNAATTLAQVLTETLFYRYTTEAAEHLEDNLLNGSSAGQPSIRPISRLHFQARHDALTGLPNRTLFDEKLRQAIARAKRHERRFAVAFIDLDAFKPINDTLGHGVGDEYLVTLSQRMANSIRTEDTLARWGGDEFVVLLEDVHSLEGATGALNRLLHNLGQPLCLQGTRLRPSASIGLALYPDHGTQAKQLLDKADQAMYRAKRAGGHRVIGG